jgi:hypothetical protein
MSYRRRKHWQENSGRGLFCPKAEAGIEPVETEGTQPLACRICIGGKIDGRNKVD